MHKNGNFLQSVIRLTQTPNLEGCRITTEACCEDVTMYYNQSNQVTNQLTLTIFLSDVVRETK